MTASTNNTGPTVDPALGDDADQRVTPATKRRSREQTMRVNDPMHLSTHDDVWEEPQLLDVPPPREGMVQRWISTVNAHGHFNRTNINVKMRAGWRPRKVDSMNPDDRALWSSIDFNDEAVIGVEGMVLMERPAKLHARYKAKVEQRKSRQVDAIEQNLYRVHTPGSGMGQPTTRFKQTIIHGTSAVSGESNSEDD